MSSWWFVAGIIVAAWVGCGLGVIAAGLAIRGAAPELGERAVGTLTLELEAGYPNGATGAIVLSWPLVAIEAGEKAVRVPPGADRIVARIADRAGVYAGASVTTEHESEPPPAFLRGRP